MRFKFHPQALEDYQQAVNWYAPRGTTLAESFMQAVEGRDLRIAENPARWRVIEEDVHRCLTRVFPFGILYTIESDYVLIVAVMHCSREPGYWRHRLEAE